MYGDSLRSNFPKAVSDGSLQERQQAGLNVCLDRISTEYDSIIGQ
jgi:hypothetical protein